MAAEQNQQEKPPIRWLRGDEVIMTPGGILAPMVWQFAGMPTGTFREALAIWPGDQVPITDALRAAAVRASNVESIKIAEQRVQRNIPTRKQIIAQNIYALSDSMGRAIHTERMASALSDLEIEALHKKNAIRKTLESITTTPAKFAIMQEERRFHDLQNSIQRRFVVDAESIQRCRQVIDASPVFDGAMRDLLAYADIPIAVIDHLDDFCDTPEGKTVIVGRLDGLAVNSRYFQDLSYSKDETDRYAAQRDLAHGLVSAALQVIAADSVMLGLDALDRQRAVAAEFEKHRQSIMLPQQYRADIDSPNSSPVNILGQMHFALTSGYCDAEKVRAEMPECAAMYDRFMQQVQQVAAAHKANPLHEIIQLAPADFVARKPTRDKPASQTRPASAQMPEFLRGDELVINEKKEFHWYFSDRDNAFARATPYYLSPQEIRKEPTPAAQKQMAEGLMHERRKSFQGRTKHLLEELATNQRFVVGAESDGTTKSAVAYTKKMEKLIHAPNEYLKAGAVRAGAFVRADAEEKIARALGEATPLLLPQDEYDAARDTLEKTPAFRGVATFLAQSHMPVTIFRQLPGGKNDIKCALNQGLMMSRDFIGRLRSPDPTIATDAEGKLYRVLSQKALIASIDSLYATGAVRSMSDASDEYAAMMSSVFGVTDGVNNQHIAKMVHGFLLAMQHADAEQIITRYPNYTKLCKVLISTINPDRFEELLNAKKAAEAVPPEAKIVDLSGRDFAPKLFTNNPREQELIDAVRPFIGEALHNEPPCEQFRCHLVLSDRNGQDNFPIHLMFRNADGVTKEFTVYTGTHDLDEAIALKKALQSHVLNYPGVEPLRLRYRGESPDQPTTQTSAMMPRHEPSSVELVDYGRCYAARFHFTGASGSAQVIVPLGLRYEPHRPLVVAEAGKRLDYLQQHIAHTRAQGYWETLGEVVQDLKRAVTERRLAGEEGTPNNSHFGWRVAETMRLEDFGDVVGADGRAMQYPLHFPAQGPQSTVLKAATLRLEDGEKNPNPSWRLHFTVSVAGLGTHGQEGGDYHASINLHTADAAAAQMRGAEAMQSLVETLQLRSHDMRWHAEGEKSAELFLRHPDGSCDPDPEPQTLFHVIEDMPNPKQTFQITTQTKPGNRDGYLTVSLGVQRGSKAESDLIEFHDLNGHPLRRSFEVSTRDADKVEGLAKAINDTFRNYLSDAYGNRTVNQNGEVIRKTRQEYRTATIRNLFDKAVVSHVGEGMTFASHTDAAQARNTRVARG